MPFIPKIEIFKLVLKNKKLQNNQITFREFFRAKTGHYHNYNPKPTSSLDIFKIYFENIVTAINHQRYNVDEENKKAFTVAVGKDEAGNPVTNMRLHADSEFITGIFQGGHHGRIRTIGKIDNTADRSDLTKDNSVDDLYYFLLYTPIDHSEGLLILQCTTDFKISGVVKYYLQQYFSSGDNWKCKFEPYILKSYRDLLEKEAKFDSVTFTSGWKVDGEDYDEPKPTEHTLKVRVQITDTSKKKSDLSLIKKIYDWVGASRFTLNGREEILLADFERTAFRVESQGRSMAFDFDSEDGKISPVILLNPEVYLNTDSSLNFGEIDKECRRLLAEIQQEFFPDNAIDDAQ